MLACQAVAVCWYATAGHHPADLDARRPELAEIRAIRLVWENADNLAA